MLYLENQFVPRVEHDAFTTSSVSRTNYEGSGGDDETALLYAGWLLHDDDMTMIRKGISTFSSSRFERCALML